MVRGDLRELWRTGSVASARRVTRELSHWVDRLVTPSVARQRRLGRLTWMSLVAGPAAGLGAQAASGGALSSIVTASLAAGTAAVGASLDYVKSQPDRITTRRVVQYLRRRNAGVRRP